MVYPNTFCNHLPTLSFCSSLIHFLIILLNEEFLFILSLIWCITLLQLKDSVWRPNYYSPTPHADSLNSLIDSVKMIDNKIIINDRFHIFELSEGKYKVYIDRGRTSDDYKECKTNIEIINSPKNKKPEYVLRYLPDLYCWSQLSNDPSLEPILIDTVKIYDVDQIIPILVNI